MDDQDLTTPEEVDRWEVIHNANGLGFSDGIRKSPHGGFVALDDYLALAAKLDATEADLIDIAQKGTRVITELEARIEALTAERDKAQRDRDCFKRTTRAHWHALCAMRNSINEYVPMPNTDSGPLFSPEDGPIYADIAERVVARIKEDRDYASALEQELKDRAAPADIEALVEAAKVVVVGDRPHYGYLKLAAALAAMKGGAE